MLRQVSVFSMLIIDALDNIAMGGVIPYVESSMCEFNNPSIQNLADDAFLTHFYGQFLADDVF